MGTGVAIALMNGSGVDGEGVLCGEHQLQDVNLALEELAPGSRFVDGRVEVIPEEVEGDQRLPGDQRTALVIQSIANSICPSIQMEIDYPSRHESGWMPLLNLQVRDKEDNNIDYKWYGKKVSNPLLMNVIS